MSEEERIVLLLLLPFLWPLNGASHDNRDKVSVFCLFVCLGCVVYSLEWHLELPYKSLKTMPSRNGSVNDL